MGMISFMINHFMELLPILALGALGIAVIVERSLSLFVRYPLRENAAFFDTVRGLVVSDRVNKAVAFCDKYRAKPIAGVVKQGLLRAHQPQEIIEDGLEIAAGEAVDRIRARTSFLSMIANVSTLLGLIGTIMGLIRSFEAVGSANAQERSALLAQGISMAMNHTLWGLCVAVPCMIAFSFLQNRTNRLKAEIERSVVRTMDILKQRYVSTGDFDSHDEQRGRAQRRAL